MSVNVMSWNINAGGYAGYDETLPSPERGQAILDVISDARAEHDVDSLILPDAFRWGEIKGGDKGIARHLGFNAAHFVLLDDERLNRDAGKHIGIAMATDKPVHRWRDIDLETRQAASVTLDVGSHGLQLVGVYLDDLSEATRVQQVRALRSNIEKDVPTIVMGDFNMLRPDVYRARQSDRIIDQMLRIGSPLLRAMMGQHPIAKTLIEFNKRQAYDEMADDGTTIMMDADYEKIRPTETRLGHLSVDYAFLYRVGLDDFVVLDSQGASDHKPIIAKTSGQPIDYDKM